MTEVDREEEEGGGQRLRQEEHPPAPASITEPALPDDLALNPFHHAVYQ